MSDIPIRRGLPREPGGEPWPPAGSVHGIATQMHDADASSQPTAPDARAGQAVSGSAASGRMAHNRAGADAEAGSVGVASAGVDSVASTSSTVASDAAPTADGNLEAARTTEVAPVAIRRGLPRVAGGEPWPVVEGLSAASAANASSNAMQDIAPAPAASTAHLRRGLPREVGGEPWPATAVVAVSDLASDTGSETTLTGDSHAGASEVESGLAASAAAASDSALAQTTDLAASESRRSGISQPAAKVSEAPGAEDAVVPQEVKAAAKPEAKLYRGKPLSEWARIGVLSAAGLVVVALVAVFGVRWLLSTEPMQDFLVRYPGEYELPANAPEGFPTWLRWSHFFNVFLMVLIIRSGWQIRTEKKPQAYWTPRWNKSRKISLTMWFHQSIDLLWVINGLVFVVLLFATGQWMRIVPTSWDVFPNALSAGLQYVSLDWPVEDGWVNYNSLQQLAYFVTVFVAAPLAVLSGVRMSGLWPNKPGLNKVYPIEAARAVHFPVMIYFVVFILTHVFLVLSTGALRNLNHIYTGTSEVSWVGFWLFVLSLGVIVGGVLAARAVVIAPIASLFGRVGR